MHLICNYFGGKHAAETSSMRGECTGVWETANNHHSCLNPTAIILTSRQLCLVIEARRRQDAVQLAEEDAEWEGESK